jgi:hypothetical protein
MRNKNENLLVYVFDFDFDKKGKERNHSDIDNRIDIVVFADRRKLHESIKERRPDIILFDLYSNSESTSCYNEILNDEHIETIEQPVERALNKMQATRQYARRVLKNRSHPTGIDEIHALVYYSNVPIDFPIAIFSRYGRHLLSTEDLLKIQKLGAYFVWKSKEKVENRYMNGFSKRELISIYSVIDAYEENIARFSVKLLEEKHKINRIEKKLRMRWYSRCLEYWFILAILCAAVIHGRPLFGNEVNTIIDLVSDFASYKLMSPIMILTAVAYAALVTFRNKNTGILLEAHKVTSSIINDLIATRKVDSK